MASFYITTSPGPTPIIKSTALTVLHSVLLRVHQEEERFGRPLEQVQVVAVSKTKLVSLICQVYNVGHYCFSENYMMEIIEKAIHLLCLSETWTPLNLYEALFLIA